MIHPAATLFTAVAITLGGQLIVITIRPAQFQFGSTSSQEIINFFLLSEAK